MNKVIFAFLLLLEHSVAQAACRDLTNDVLGTQGMVMADPTVLQRPAKSVDSRKLKKQQAQLTMRLVYDRPGGSNYGEDVDILLEGDAEFTEIRDYEKGNVQVRTFEDKRAGMSAIRLKVNKKMTIFNVNKSCVLDEVVLLDAGARCYFKKIDCQKLYPLTASKLKGKCSLLTDLSEETVSLMAKSCEVFEKSNSSTLFEAKAGQTPQGRSIKGAQ